MPGAGAAAGGAGGADAGVCAKLVATLNARLAQIAKFRIISSHPAAALRVEDHSLAAAPSSKPPTKQYHPRRPSPETRGNFHRAAAVWPMTRAVPESAPGFALAPAEAESPAAELHSPSRTAHPTAASSLRSPRKSTYAAGPEFAALSANS